MDQIDKYGLDLHCNFILDEYGKYLPVFEKIQQIATDAINREIEANGILVTALNHRIKTERSLAGKLELKGDKYNTISDLTDIVGLRVITFFSEEVDKVSALAEKLFKIDWKNSVDKRKMHELDNFGYLSLHYICSIPKSLYYDPEMPQVNEFRFELQMRSALQHVWATMYHDTGYKSGVEIPTEYLRGMNRLAGLLELADAEFSRIRTGINDYRRNMENLVRNGDFDKIPLNGDSFRSYLKVQPFDKLNRRIAAINQAEIHESSLIPYLKVFLKIGFTTLGDLDKLLRDYSEDAYQLATYRLGNTDIDIVASTIALQNLCEVYILKNGGGAMGLEQLFDAVFGKSEYNATRAEKALKEASNLEFMNK